MLQAITLALAATTAQYQPIDVVAASTISLERISNEMYLNQPEENPEKTEMSVSSSHWGSQGTWRFGIVGGYAKDVKHSENTLVDFGVEFEYFVEDDLSIDLGFLGADFDQEGGTTKGFNFTLQLRWHAIVKENWSFFLEGGAGLLRTSDKVPSDGSRFNFTPQAGIGFTFDIGNNARWMVGAKWHHISNANTYSSNPGRDSIMYWTGISFPF
jgi:hypothetical protein